MTYDFKQANGIRRFVRTSASWKLVSVFYSYTLHHLDRAVYRATKGKSTFTAWVAGLPMCMLTTTGAKSGLPRTVPLAAIPDGADFIVIASNYGGTSNPAWCHNLRANPKATIAFEGKRQELVASEVQGPERDTLYARGMEIYPGWAAYKKRANRTIPIFRLSPVVQEK